MMKKQYIALMLICLWLVLSLTPSLRIVFCVTSCSHAENCHNKHHQSHLSSGNCNGLIVDLAQSENTLVSRQEKQTEQDVVKVTHTSDYNCLFALAAKTEKGQRIFPPPERFRNLPLII